MKARTILALLMTVVCLNTNAQSQDWYVSVGASAGYYLGEDDEIVGFSKHISPSATLAVGKWFNPFWAVQIGGNYGKIKGAGLGETPYNTGESFVAKYGETGNKTPYYEKFNFFTIQPEVVYNASNGMCGYNPNRVWNVLAHIGPSFARSWANGESQNSIFLTLGITNKWRLCRNVALWMDGRVTLFGKKFDKVTYRDEIDCMPALSAGVTVNFGKKD